MSKSSSTLTSGFRRNGGKPGFGGRVILFLFATPFIGLGGFFMYMGGLKPVWKAYESRSWVETVCRIDSSSVGRHRGSDSTTYSIDITFTYEWEGQTYQSATYNLVGISSSGRKGKEKVVARYPRGAERICFVNPHRPEEAVLSRQLGWLPFFIIPFSGIFVLVGAGLMFGAATGKSLDQNESSGGFRSRKKGVSPAGRTPALRQAPLRPGGFPRYEPDPLVLKPEVGRIGGLIGLSFFAVFWNGILSVFLLEFFDGSERGVFGWFFALFLIPFVLVGLALIGGVIYTFLSLFNPKLELTLRPGTPRLGDSCRLEWRFEGNVKRLQGMKMVLEAEEVARYRRGTSTYTDRNIFEQVVLVDTDATLMQPTGVVDLVLPPDTAPSFKSSNNEILWTVKVRGVIPRWPDVSATFPITVLPSGTKTR